MRCEVISTALSTILLWPFTSRYVKVNCETIDDKYATLVDPNFPETLEQVSRVTLCCVSIHQLKATVAASRCSRTITASRSILQRFQLLLILMVRSAKISNCPKYLMGCIKSLEVDGLHQSAFGLFLHVIGGKSSLSAIADTCPSTPHPSRLIVFLPAVFLPAVFLPAAVSTSVQKDNPNDL